MADCKSDNDKELTDDAKKEIEEQDSDLKIILLGDSAVGKSKLVERYLMDQYVPRQLSTYALTLFRKDVELNGKNLKVDFWDTAGQERFSGMHPSYYYNAHACILVFDVTRKQTYQHLTDWYKELTEFCENIPVIVVANKIDIDPRVTNKKFKFADKHNLKFYFASAADGTNIVQVFEEAIELANCKKRDDPNLFEMLDELNFGAESEAKSEPKDEATAKESAKDS
jgi:Rab-like protein 2